MGRSKHLTPAELVIGLFGIRPLAAEIGCSPTTVLRWRDSDGGKVSQHYQAQILELARKRGERLTADELIHGRAT